MNANKDGCKISDVVTQIICGHTVEKISNMFSFKEGIVIGISGGADSVAMTYFLFEISNYYKFKLVGCHINHGIRGKEADDDQAFVKNYCNQLGLELLVKKVDLPSIARKEKKSLEEAGREVRYAFFNECSEKYNAKIATAHTMSDNAETVLLNLIRGSGLKGLCGIPARRGNIIRPFINFTRYDVEKYCENKHLKFVTDSTNFSTDYSRNLIRHKIIPEISKINSNFNSTINRNCDIILKDELFLDSFSEKASQEVLSSKGYDINKLADLPENIQNRVIKKILNNNNVIYNSKKINNILKFLFSNNIPIGKAYVVLALNGKNFLKKKPNYFYIQQVENKEKIQNIKLSLYSSEAYKYFKYSLEPYENIKNEVLKNKQFLKWCIDYDRIIGEPFLRHRSNGDKITLIYRKVTKSLKKLFNEEKLTQEEKEKIFVMADDVGVIWVEGFGADKRVNVSSETKTVLVLSKL